MEVKLKRNEETINDGDNLMNKLNFRSEQGIKDVRKFKKLINYEHLVQYNRNYPDNHSDFMAKVMVISSELKIKTQHKLPSDRLFHQENPIK